MTQQRILMATDVPFWRKSTGAEQRMAALVNSLSTDSFEVRTFYLGQTNSDRFTQRDQELISQQRLNVEQRSSEQATAALTAKLSNLAQFTLNHLNPWRDSANQIDLDNEPTSVPALEDYRWPWALEAFQESVAKSQPTAIIIQYVKLSYLLDGLTETQRQSTRCLIDTHDVLHQRAAQFRERGFQHWIELTREQESAELQKFDTIIAIQDEEAKLFEEMAPQAETIVCGHAVEHSTNQRGQPSSNPNANSNADATWASNTKDIITIGYLGSVNASNAQALENFLMQAWIPLMESELANQYQIVIAGGICQWIVATDFYDSIESEKVDLLGSIADLETFYNRVDVIINPVEFGTGLKIKNCEAIAFGKPVLTTSQGCAGFAEALKPATLICDSPAEFLFRLQELAVDADGFCDLKAAATKLSQAGFSDQEVYSALKQALRTPKQAV